MDMGMDVDMVDSTSVKLDMDIYYTLLFFPKVRNECVILWYAKILRWVRMEGSMC